MTSRISIRPASGVTPQVKCLGAEMRQRSIRVCECGRFFNVQLQLYSFYTVMLQVYFSVASNRFRNMDKDITSPSVFPVPSIQLKVIHHNSRQNCPAPCFAET